MVRRIFEIMVTLDFIFRLVHCSSEDVSFNIICLNVLEGIKLFYLLMWFKKTRLETPFKGDNVKALVETSNCENFVLYFSEKVKKIAAFAMLFWFSVTKQSFENGIGFSQWSEIPTLPASLKIKRHFRTAAAFGNSDFFKMENLFRWSALVSSWQQMILENWCGWAHPYKTIAKFIVHSIFIFDLSKMFKTMNTLRDVSYNARWFWTTVRYGHMTTAYLCWTTGNGF